VSTLVNSDTCPRQVEPTESESLQELDRMCDALLAIREEIRELEEVSLEQFRPSDNWSKPLSTALNCERLNCFTLN
jgi:glycine cleavage system protein P-like pyridoxal-binding family